MGEDELTFIILMGMVFIAGLLIWISAFRARLKRKREGKTLDGPIHPKHRI